MPSEIPINTKQYVLQLAEHIIEGSNYDRPGPYANAPGMQARYMWLVPKDDVIALADAVLTAAEQAEPDTDDEPCPVCGDGDRVPAYGYWRCPKCDAEWDDPDAQQAPQPDSRLREALEEIANGCDGRVGRDILPCRIARAALAQEDRR